MTILYRAAKDEDATAKSRIRTDIRDILDNREKLLLEVGRMVRLGRLLKTRLKESLYQQPMSEAEETSILGSNLTAVEAISAKLAEVTLLAEKLDARLCEAGARTRPISIPTAVTSSSSSLLSISAISPSGTPIRTTSIATAPASGATASVPSAIAQMRPASSETTTVVGKSVTPMAEKSDESLLHIPSSHSTEDVETSNKDSGTKELTENPCSENTAEECNVEGYTTATECSTTPPSRSRSASFVTSPECEDLSTTAPVTSLDSTWWATETSKVTTTAEPLVSASSNENQTLKFIEATSNICATNGIKPTQIETMEKITDERSGRIVKEVTETTVLRVSHDVRLGVASYKLTSNIIQDHRQHIDAKNFQNIERMLPAECHEKTDDIHRDLDLSQYKESEKYGDRCSKKIQSDQYITRSDLREYEDVSSQDLLRHHEDSGIDMSPMKKDDNLESEDFLERARKL